MLRLLFVGRDKDIFKDMSSALKDHEDIDLALSGSGEEALAMLSEVTFDLIVADEDLGDMTGIELVKRVLKINFMINFALISRMSPDDFHEASEGLGIMCQMDEHPDRKDAEVLIETLRRIKGLL